MIMPVATANGKKFTFPEGTTPEQMGEAIDEYFAGQPAPAAKPQAAAPVGPSPEQQTVDEMGHLERGLVGMGGSFHGLGIGAQQILASLMGDEAKQAELFSEAQEHKRLMAPVEDTAAGLTGAIGGNVAAALPIGMAAAAAAPATLPGLVLAGAAEGATMGALAPTSKEGERAENIAWGGGLGGAVPVAGTATRKLIGEADPVVKKAAEVLKRYGVNVPKADQSPGGLSKGSSFLLENMPGVNLVMASKAGAKEDKVREGLFRMLGVDVPHSNEEMQAVLEGIGSKVGSASVGKKVPLSGLQPKLDGLRKTYNQLLPSQQKKEILRHMAFLDDVASTPGAKLKGEAYQRIRSDLSAEAARSSGEHAAALRGLRDALDSQFNKTLTKEEAATVAKNKEMYQIAKALRKVDIKEGKLDIRKARQRVEKAAERAPVMKEARELLQAADVGIPRVKTGLSAPSLTQGALSLLNPVLAAKFLGGGVGARAVLNTGAPQWAASNPVVRSATAKAVRGYTQSELSDED